MAASSLLGPMTLKQRSHYSHRFREGLRPFKAITCHKSGQTMATSQCPLEYSIADP